MKKYIQQCKRAWPLVAVGLFALVTLLYAATPSRYYIKGLMTYWSKTDTSLAVNVDTANAITRNYIKRLADSVAANRTGQDYVVYRLYGVLPGGASDSVNLQVGVNGVYEAILGNFNMAAFNFSLVATTPSSLISTWRTDLPALSNADSLFFIRISRNDAMNPKCAATIYKLPKAYGPDINDKTVGTFYDMIRFSDTILPAGSNKFFTFDLAMRRQP